MKLDKTVFSSHARDQMAFRKISENEIAKIIEKPESIIKLSETRVVLHGIMSNGKRYLVRVFIDIDRNPPEVVTVYRTSKLSKYGVLS